MMSRFEDIRGRTSGDDSVKIQIYQLQARELMKKSVEKAGGETGTKNTKELCCKRKTAVHHADKKNVVDTRRADRSRASCEREVAMKSSPSAQHNGSSVHAEQERGQSCGCAGACMCKCNNVHARECEHNKHDVRARACLHELTHSSSRMYTCKKKRAEEGQQSARLGSSLSVCECACICKHSHFECTCHNVRMSANMYKNAEACKYKCVCEKPTTCGIKAGICMCAGIKSTHRYAWYGRACTAPCTCNVVFMCGKIHAQESEKNNNNTSNKIIRLGRYGWGRNVCQEACRKAVGRATCMCVCMCTTHTGKQNSRVIVAAGAARRGGGVSQPTSSRFMDTSSLDKRGSDKRRCDKRRRGSDERGSDERGSYERESDKRGRDERGSVDKERRCNMLQGIAVCCIIL